MKLVLISLDLSIAMPIVLIVLSTFLAYAYTSVAYLSSSSLNSSSLFRLYASSGQFYGKLSGISGYNATSGSVIYSSRNLSAEIEPGFYTQGCGAAYVCRAISIGGRLETLVVK